MSGHSGQYHRQAAETDYLKLADAYLELAAKEEKVGKGRPK